MRALPSYNFKQGYIDGVETITGQHLIAGGYLKGRTACHACFIGCHRFTAVDSGKYAGARSGGPEYETMTALGSGCGITDVEAVIRGNQLCNLYGMDTISAGGVVQWAMECVERGVLGPEDTDGLDLTWGNADAVIDLLEKIARREGLGNLLAEGVKTASERVEGGSRQWAVQAKGLEMSRVEVRSAMSYALAFAVNPRGPDHLHTEVLAEFGINPLGRALVKRITGDEKYATPYSTEKRAELVRWHEDCYAATEGLGMCVFTSTARYGVTPDHLARLFSAIVGVDVSTEELMLAGRRTVTLERCYNMREGLRRKDDTLPPRSMGEALTERGYADTERPEAIVTKKMLDKMLDEYYVLHGWNPETGIPEAQTLEMLGLAELVGELPRE